MMQRCLRHGICRFQPKRGLAQKIMDVVDEQEKNVGIRLTAYGDTSLEVNNITIEAPVLAFSDTYLLWDIKSFRDINMDSLAPVHTYFPTVEVLFLGLGVHASRRLPPEVMEGMKKKGIIVEVSSTFNAASTFNVLVAEGRNIATALVPDTFFDPPPSSSSSSSRL